VRLRRDDCSTCLRFAATREVRRRLSGPRHDMGEDID